MNLRQFYLFLLHLSSTFFLHFWALFVLPLSTFVRRWIVFCTLTCRLWVYLCLCFRHTCDDQVSALFLQVFGEFAHLPQFRRASSTAQEVIGNTSRNKSIADTKPLTPASGKTSQNKSCNTQLFGVMTFWFSAGMDNWQPPEPHQACRWLPSGPPVRATPNIFININQARSSSWIYLFLLQIV